MMEGEEGADGRGRRVTRYFIFIFPSQNDTAILGAPGFAAGYGEWVYQAMRS